MTFGTYADYIYIYLITVYMIIFKSTMTKYFNAV